MFPGLTYGPPPFYPPTRPSGNNPNGANNDNTNPATQAGQPQTLISPTPTYVATTVPWGQPQMGYGYGSSSVQYGIRSAHQGRPMGLQTWTAMQRAGQGWPQPVSAGPASYQSFNPIPASYAQPAATQAYTHSTNAQQVGGTGHNNRGDDSGEGLFKTDEELLGQSAFNNPQLPLGRQHWPSSLVPGQPTNVNTLYHCERCDKRSQDRICPECRTLNTSMHGSYYFDQYAAIWRNR